MHNSTARRCDTAGAWARDEFGAAQLGNKLRTARLVRLATGAAETPAGPLTEVLKRPADLEAAYRLVENKHFDERDVGGAAHRACARRASGERFVFVPVDGCTLTLTDLSGKGFGKVGTSETRARGVEVMNAIAVSPDGTPLGLCGQTWWTRRDEVQAVPSHKRALHAKETRYWLKCMESVDAAFAAAQVTTPRWYQLDAGADFRELLAWAERSGEHVTVRAAQNRRVADGDQLLFETVAATASLGRFELRLPRGRKRVPRVAILEVRSRRVELKLPGGSGDVELQAVLVEELGDPSVGEERISWLLLTNMEVESFDDARLVVYGYSQRWRVEEFHKAWKSVCRVEESQLEVLAFKIWATVLASVAMRIERLKYLARNEPDAAATVELTIIALKTSDGYPPPKDYTPDKVPTIAQAVRWIAELGGYVGAKRSGGPPGTVVIGRGLEHVEIAAQAISGLLATMAKT
jgi:hypothetical protein